LFPLFPISTVYGSVINTSVKGFTFSTHLLIRVDLRRETVVKVSGVNLEYVYPQRVHEDILEVAQKHLTGHVILKFKMFRDKH
jgi:hypothetical protein